MTERQFDRDEQWLAEQFCRAMPALPDAGFSGRVVGRIRRGAWLRGFLPYAALLVGGAFALWSVLPLLGLLGPEIAQVGALDWAGLVEANRTVVMVLVLGAASPLLVAMLED